jgi:hypothetical protein
VYPHHLQSHELKHSKKRISSRESIQPAYARDYAGE